MDEEVSQEVKLSRSIACNWIVIGVVHGQVVPRHHDIGFVVSHGSGGVVPGG